MFKVLAHGATDMGRERKNNEDTYRIEPDAHLYLVCDGMGGHASGEIASQIAADAMVAFLKTDRFASSFRWPRETLTQVTEETRCLDAAVRQANIAVYSAALANPEHKGMGTTLAGVFAGRHRLGLVHVGDSRIYRFRDNELEQLTEDHSLLNHYLRTRPMSAQQIRGFAGKNVIVRAVGLRDLVEPEVQIQEYCLGDIYLLCSDGLTDMVPDEAIAQTLATLGDDLSVACASLVNQALQGGGKDNITLVLVHVQQDLDSLDEADSLDGPGAGRGAGLDDTSPGFDVADGGALDAETQSGFEMPTPVRNRLAVDRNAVTQDGPVVPAWAVGGQGEINSGRGRLWGSRNRDQGRPTDALPLETPVLGGLDPTPPAGTRIPLDLGGVAVRVHPGQTTGPLKTTDRYGRPFDPATPAAGITAAIVPQEQEVAPVGRVHQGRLEPRTQPVSDRDAMEARQAIESVREIRSRERAVTDPVAPLPLSAAALSDIDAPTDQSVPGSRRAMRSTLVERPGRKPSPSADDEKPQ